MQTLRHKYAEATRQTLLDSALQLFAERDYTDLSAEELVRAAGVTRGALYHHFDGKRGLFEAVCEQLQSQAAQRISAAIDTAEEPLERAERGIAEFLDICAEDRYRHVVLEQGPIALGWPRWRELDDRHLGTLVVREVQTLLDAALIRRHPANLIAAAFNGALGELSLAIAEFDDARQAHIQAASLARDLLRGLVTDRSDST